MKGNKTTAKEINSDQQATVIQIEQELTVDLSSESQESTADLSSESQESTVDLSSESQESTIEKPNQKQEPTAEQSIQKEALKVVEGELYKWIRAYFNKFAGLHEQRPPRLHWQEYFWSFIGAFLSILAITLFHYRFLSKRSLIYVIGSFGASAVLIYGAPRSPFSQPRNLIGGHLLSAICGCVVRVAIDRYEHSVACALSVAIAILVMQFTETTHPPGGATALLAITTQPALPGAHFLFILMPVLTGAITMLIVALFVNNLSPKRTYPTFWW